MAVRVYSRKDQGLTISNNFGWIGELRTVTLHHSAGPRAKTKARCVELNRTYSRMHASYGWGGIGYHLIMDDLGRLYEARPRAWKGAHTAGLNTGNVGVMIHGNYTRDRLKWRQRRTLKKLYRGQVQGWRVLGELPWRGHLEQPGQSTACPGRKILRVLRRLRRRWPR